MSYNPTNLNLMDPIRETIFVPHLKPEKSKF